MSVVPIPPRREWFGDARSGERALRVSWHKGQACFVLSTWRGSTCVGTVQLGAADAARLIAALGSGLAAGSRQQGEEVAGTAGPGWRGDDLPGADEARTGGTGGGSPLVEVAKTQPV